MSNEVYIDGCNVAECEFYDRCNYTTCQIGIQNYIDCDKNPNCYYKQLQRAKAELEQYKKSKQASYETMQKEWNAAINEYRKIILENEKLKEENKEWQKRYDLIQDDRVKLWTDNTNFKQALEDIKNLLFTAENTTNGNLYFELVSKAYMKCNEVLND